MNHRLRISRLPRRLATTGVSLVALAASSIAQLACGSIAGDPAALGSQAGADTTGSGSGSDPTGGGGDPTGGGGDPTGGGGGATGGGGDVHIPTDLVGAGITLAYSGHAQYVLPAWNTLPQVQVVDQLMIATYAQPDFNGPVTTQNATLFLHVVGDPFVDTYVFNFAPGTPGDPGSFQDSNGFWFRRSGGAPSQAGPPFTGRPEIIMGQAANTAWTSLSEWSIPQLYIPNGWPSSGSFRAFSQIGLISLNATAGIVAALYGLAAVSAFGGGPLCAPATATCGGSIVRVAGVFVVAYNTMQAAISGQRALQAAAGGVTVVSLIALWRSQLVQGALSAVITSAGTCAASAATCGAEAAHFCGLSQAVPGNAIICAQDTRLTAFNGAGIGFAATIFLAGGIDIGVALFNNFGWAIGN